MAREPFGEEREDLRQAIIGASQINHLVMVMTGKKAKIKPEDLLPWLKTGESGPSLADAIAENDEAALAEHDDVLAKKIMAIFGGPPTPPVA